MKNRESIAYNANTMLSPGIRIFRKGAGFSSLNRGQRLHKQCMRPRERRASIIAGNCPRNPINSPNFKIHSTNFILIFSTSEGEFVRTGGPQVPAPHETMICVFPFCIWPQLVS